MAYTPNPQSLTEEMLDSIGLKSMQELFTDIPDELKLAGKLNLDDSYSEISLRMHLQELANKNINVDQYPCFLGAGAYDHFIPAAVDPILMRSEIYTHHTLPAGNKSGYSAGYI